MSLEAWIGIAGAVVGLAGAYYAQRALYPDKRALAVGLESIPVPKEGKDGEVAYSEDGGVVFVQSVGRYDVRGEDFHEEAPLIVSFGKPALTCREQLSDNARPLRCKLDRGRLLVGPDLLKVGNTHRFEVTFLEKTSRVMTDSRLVDVKIKNYLDPLDKGIRTLLPGCALVALGGVAFGLALGHLAGLMAAATGLSLTINVLGLLLGLAYLSYKGTKGVQGLRISLLVLALAVMLTAQVSILAVNDAFDNLPAFRVDPYVLKFKPPWLSPTPLAPNPSVSPPFGLPPRS